MASKYFRRIHSKNHSPEVLLLSLLLTLSFLELGGGIGIVEMLFKCNILALVGGGNIPKFPLTKVIIWDDHQIKIIGELTFKTDIKAVKLKSDKVVIVLENKIYVYNFSDLKLIDHIDTSKNTKGSCL